MKAGWDVKPLGDLLSVLKNGINCKQDKSGNGVKISRIESISDATFNSERVGYADLSEAEKQRYCLKKGDILFSHINSPVHVGKTAIFDCDEALLTKSEPRGLSPSGLCRSVDLLPDWHSKPRHFVHRLHPCKH
ncbi:hypothetical protein, partial [Aeromonas media]|uniref:hypothetical protein n=1 Tax=Aeromonas media TaxID=651 RepID=UPI001C598A6D